MPRRSNIPEKILSILVENPNVTRDEIKNRLGVSYQAVQKHLSSMQQQGLVVPSFSVAEINIKKYLFWVFILTQAPKGYSHDDEEVNEIRNDYQRRLCDEIAESFHKKGDLVGGLIFGGTDIIIGGIYDIILRLYSDNPNSVGRYVTQFLRSHPSTAQTSTAWSLIDQDRRKS